MYFLLDRVFCLTPELVHRAISIGHIEAEIDDFLRTAEQFAKQTKK